MSNWSEKMARVLERTKEHWAYVFKIWRESDNTFPASIDNDGNAILKSVRLTATSTPASAAATGTTGDIAWDSSYLYVCVATDTWKRVAIATWP